ncbi:MAG: leucine-rich repeat domain-containing protein [Tidjanibacter sp.]|nr:leucine-rich repeat domain-containing protein [Tidjanibacter sp.]
MNLFRKGALSLMTAAVALLCSCSGFGPDLPEPEIPADQIIAYTAAEQTGPFATGAFLATLKENNFTPEGEGGCGEMIFESTVYMAGAMAFMGRTALWTIDLPAQVASIGNKAFEGCTALRRVEMLGDKVTILGSNAFYGCTSLEEFHIPDGVMEIFNDTFYNCKSLRTLTLGAGVEYIGDQAFYGCSSLESVEIPERVTFVGNRCFDGATSLREVIIRGNRVLDIGSRAFVGNKAQELTNLTIRVPASLLKDYRSSFFWEAYVDCLAPIEE